MRASISSITLRKTIGRATQPITWLMLAAVIAASALPLAGGNVAEGQTTPNITLTAATPVAENTGSATITMTLENPPSQGRYIQCGVRPLDGNPGTATSDDYTLPHNDKRLRVNGNWTANVELTIIDDTIDDNDETINLVGYCANSELGASPDHNEITATQLGLTITDDDPNNQPMFPVTETWMRSINENSPPGSNVGTAFAATDGDNDLLVYTLTGPDAGSFSIDVNGQISVATGAQLDYETNDSYTVTVEVKDNKDGSSNPDTVVDRAQDVTITVNNVEEPGTVTIGSGAVAELGTIITAILSDPDEGVTEATWKWQSSPTGTGPWTAISEATISIAMWARIRGSVSQLDYAASSYAPALGDIGRYLQATVTYTDALGAGKQATSSPTSAVASQAAPAPTSLRAAAGVGEVALSWDSAADNTITEYQRQQNGSSWEVIPGGTSATSVTVTGLGDGQSYTFRVRAMRGTVEGTPAFVNVALSATCTRHDVRVDPSKTVPSATFDLAFTFAGNCRPAGFTDAIFTVLLHEDIGVPTDFGKDHIYVHTTEGSFVPNYVFKRSDDDGDEEIEIAGCGQWRHIGASSNSASTRCADVGSLRSIQLRGLTLPSRPASAAEETYDVSIQWGSNAAFAGTIDVGATLEIEGDKLVGFGESIKFQGSGFSDGVTANLYAQPGTGSDVCTNAGRGSWTNIGSTNVGTDHRFESDVEISANVFRSAGKYLVCAVDGAGVHSGTALSIEIKVGLKVVGAGAGIEFQPGQEIALSIEGGASNLSIESVLVAGELRWALVNGGESATIST